MDTNFIFVLIGGVVLWFLYSILKELRIVRALSELPSKVKDTYDKELNELTEKISIASAIMAVTPIERPEALRARTDEYIELVKKQLEILERRRKHLSDDTKATKAQTERYLS